MYNNILYTSYISYIIIYLLTTLVYFSSRKQVKVGFTKFSHFLFSQTGVWASFPDVLNLIFVVLMSRMANDSRNKRN